MHQVTVPTKGIKELFRKLKNEGISSRGIPSSAKIRAARAVLMKIGWITLLDDYYNFGVNGISQKWGIGENNPRYGDYLTFADKEIVEKVINGRKEREGSIEVA